MEKDRVLAEIREAIELNRTVKQKNNDALSHAEYLLKRGDEYNRGLNNAWELAKKVGKYDGFKLREIFGLSECLDDFEEGESPYSEVMKMTPQEALAKLEVYEKSKDEIKVGDIVFNDSTMEEGVVTYIKDDVVFMLYSDGSCGNTDGTLSKTGKHIDISSLLEEIGED